MARAGHSQLLALWNPDGKLNMVSFIISPFSNFLTVPDHLTKDARVVTWEKLLSMQPNMEWSKLKITLILLWIHLANMMHQKLSLNLLATSMFPPIALKH